MLSVTVGRVCLSLKRSWTLFYYCNEAGLMALQLGPLILEVDLPRT